MAQQKYLSKEGLEKLEAELKHLKTIRRKEVADRIQTAKEFGDLSENAEYSDAKDEQGFVEGRIMELEDVLRNVVLIEEQGKHDSVEVGDKIKVRRESDKKEFEYDIVGSEEADPSQGKISNESPLGRAFLGHNIEDEVDVNLPSGQIKYKIVKIL
mgnify:CR=1 FL=1